jgi:hypothetical protein
MEKKDRFLAAMLLLWSETLPEHGLAFEKWLDELSPDIVRGVEDASAIEHALAYAEAHPDDKPSFF